MFKWWEIGLPSSQPLLCTTGDITDMPVGLTQVIKLLVGPFTGISINVLVMISISNSVIFEVWLVGKEHTWSSLWLLKHACAEVGFSSCYVQILRKQV